MCRRPWPEAVVKSPLDSDDGIADAVSQRIPGHIANDPGDLNLELAARVDLLAEVFMDTSARFGDARAAWQAGGRWKFAAHEVLLVSAGSGISASSDEPRAKLLAYLGIQFLFCAARQSRRNRIA